MDPAPLETLLGRVAGGDREAFEEVFALVYGDLRSRAERMIGSGSAQTLQATALVHEAWLRLERRDSLAARDRKHFLSVAASVMRSVLVDHARARTSGKRPDPGSRILLDEALAVYKDRVPDLLELNEELDQLSKLGERMARVVELRFFAGLSIEEIAEILNVGHATVERDWRAARAYLAGRLGAEDQS